MKNKVQPDEKEDSKIFFPDHEQEITTKRAFLDGNYSESPEGMVLRLYKKHGTPMKISEEGKLTSLATNKLTVYEAVNRILQDMDIIPRQAVELRWFHHLDWEDICRLVTRSRMQCNRYWRHFWTVADDTIFDP